MSSCALATLKAKIRTAQPGEVVHLPQPPFSVNVRLHNQDATLWPSTQTLIPNDVVIPLKIGKFGKTVTTKKKQTLFNYDRFELLSIFAMTYHKTQDATMDKVVLDLNKKVGTLASFSLNHFYVGFFKVKTSDNLRILPSLTGDWDHLTKLKHNHLYVCWMAGFINGKGKWLPDRCQTAFEQAEKKKSKK